MRTLPGYFNTSRAGCICTSLYKNQIAPVCTTGLAHFNIATNCDKMYKTSYLEPHPFQSKKIYSDVIERVKVICLRR